MPAVLTVDREALGEYFASREDVLFAYLFGSHARGRTHALSDVDVAVFLDDGPDSYQRLKVRLDIMGGVMRIAHTDRVDVTKRRCRSTSASFAMASSCTAVTGVGAPSSWRGPSASTLISHPA
jgi:predicted nucleotidyltransferase